MLKMNIWEIWRMHAIVRKVWVSVFEFLYNRLIELCHDKFTSLFTEEDYLEAALYSFNIQLLERAKSLTTPSCDELNLLNETLNRSNSYFPTIFTDVLKLLHSYVNRCWIINSELLTYSIAMNTYPIRYLLKILIILILIITILWRGKWYLYT